MFNFHFNTIINSILRTSTSGFNFFETQTKSYDLPLNLIERNHNVIWFALLGLTVSCLLLALSRFGSTNFIAISSKILFKNNSILKIFHEEYTISSIGSILLVLNYIVSTTTVIYLTFSNYFIKENHFLIYFLPLIPIYFLVWPILWYYLIGIVTNEHKTFDENKKNTVILSQIIGVILSVLLILWTFNIKWSYYFVYIFVFLAAFFWLFKIFRGIIFSFQHKVSWYYIILYFCTLEILPIFILLYIYQSKIGWNV